MNPLLPFVLFLFSFTGAPQTSPVPEYYQTAAAKANCEIACPGGRLVPLGGQGAYYFYPDKIEVATTEEDRPRLLLQFYKGDGLDGAVFHTMLAFSAPATSRQLDSLVKAAVPEGRYAGRYPFDIYLRKAARAHGVLVSENGRVDKTVFSAVLRPGGAEMAFAHRFNDADARSLHTALEQYPRKDFQLQFDLPAGKNGMDTRAFSVSIGAALRELKSFDQ